MPKQQEFKKELEQLLVISRKFLKNCKKKLSFIFVILRSAHLEFR